ncbi:MAG: hypothetical protein Q9172_007569 [Xanthocarpia lactea]
MPAKSRVIIDTDPGTDDVLALLYALSSSPEAIEVLLLSITFGNVNVQNCLRNVVSMFSVIEKEMSWRKDNGRPEGFDALRKSKPTIAVGADEPLGGERMKAAYYPPPKPGNTSLTALPRTPSSPPSPPPKRTPSPLIVLSSPPPLPPPISKSSTSSTPNPRTPSPSSPSGLSAPSRPQPPTPHKPF